MDEQPDRTIARPEPIDPAGLAAAVTAPYHNRSLATVNDHEIRISVMTSGFGWHIHPDSDETFLSVDGGLVIELDEGEVVLSPGQMATVPRGVRHRTRPVGARSVNLTFERKDAATIMEQGG
jgi:mannose-6-phosphate isomerase-like protein (cupin superfamily)